MVLSPATKKLIWHYYCKLNYVLYKNEIKVALKSRKNKHVPKTIMDLMGNDKNSRFKPQLINMIDKLLNANVDFIDIQIALDCIPFDIFYADAWRIEKHKHEERLILYESKAHLFKIMNAIKNNIEIMAFLNQHLLIMEFINKYQNTQFNRIVL